MSKDLRQNRNSLLMYFIGATLFPMIAHIMQKQKSVESYLGSVFGFVILGAPLLFSFWFVGHEKMKGTLRLLRILPLSEISLVRASVGLTAGLTRLILLAVLVADPALLRLTGQSKILIGLASTLWMTSAGMFCSILCTMLFIAFDHKLAMQISYLVLAGIGGLSVLVSKALDGSHSVAAHQVLSALESPVASALTLALMVPLALLASRFDARLIEWKHWSELEED